MLKNEEKVRTNTLCRLPWDLEKRQGQQILLLAGWPRRIQVAVEGVDREVEGALLQEPQDWRRMPTQCR